MPRTKSITNVRQNTRSRSLIIFASITFVGFCIVNLQLVADLDSSVGAYSNVVSPPSYSRIAKNAIDTPSQNATDNNQVLEYFRQAVGVELDDESIQRLPTWSQIESSIGDKPVLLGLERCNDFRNNVPPLRRMLGSAGMFNSGTNLVS